MIVFVAMSYQGHGDIKVFATEDGGKTGLLQMMLDHQNDPKDTNPWEGWEWWRNKAGSLCFGKPVSETRVSEGSITSYKVIE